MPEHLTFPNPKRIGKQMENPWAAYAQLHKEYKPLSLGMGYADYVASQDFNDILAKVVANSDNALTQYTQSFVSKLFYQFNFLKEFRKVS